MYNYPKYCHISVQFSYLFTMTVARKGAEILNEYKPTLIAQATLMLQSDSVR